MTLIDLKNKLEEFWRQQGIDEIFNYDMEMGAATYHSLCFFGSLLKKNFKCYYYQPSRRPHDCKFGLSPNRTVKHHQFQVFIKPFPINIKEIYLKSLEYVGLDLKKNDIRFIENNWQSTSIGAFGVGWEIWINGMEIMQFTFFKKMADIDMDETAVEFAYGLERLYMMLHRTNSFYTIPYNNHYSYKDLCFTYEQQMSHYYLDHKNIYNNCDKMIEITNNLIEKNLYFPAYETLLKLGQNFNLLVAQRLMSQVERQNIINIMRKLCHKIGIIFQSDKDNLF